uniref:Putative esophageal gland cell secretory protein 36 n=1 Tax=Meloidogyne incognita TaxID=6306 RepID=Q5QJ73_MELIC|nr:putative esophageal gland cell secretory protein 36 [Meloidogyne incognita]
MYSRSSLISFFLLINLILTPMILATNNDGVAAPVVANKDAGKVRATEIIRALRGFWKGVAGGALVGGGAVLAARIFRNAGRRGSPRPIWMRSIWIMEMQHERSSQTFLGRTGRRDAAGGDRRDRA